MYDDGILLLLHITRQSSKDSKAINKQHPKISRCYVLRVGSYSEFSQLKVLYVDYDLTAYLKFSETLANDFLSFLRSIKSLISFNISLLSVKFTINMEVWRRVYVL